MEFYNGNNSSDNYSCADNGPDSPLGYIIYYYSILYALDVVCLLGNSMTVYIVLCHRRMSRHGNVAILSLACSDFCHGIFYPIYNTFMILKVGISKFLFFIENVWLFYFKHHFGIISFDIYAYQMFNIIINL